MNEQRGNSLPLALIMTVMFLLAGVGIGVAVMEGSQRGVETDQSVSAYYMADSGVERQLFEVRKHDATVASFASLNENYPNQGSWAFSGAYATTTQKLYTAIATSSFEVIDLFDPDNVSAAGVDHVDVTWSDGADCVGGYVAGMEVGYSQWSTAGGFITINNQFTIVRNTPGSHTLTVPLSAAQAYRLRLRAFDCSASNVQVVSRNAGNAPTGFPGDVTLSAQGTYGKATQQISVTMPKTNVLSGIYSYVIFSECTLIKGTGVPACPP